MISTSPTMGLPGASAGSTLPTSSARSAPAEDSLAAFTRLLGRLAQPTGEGGEAAMPTAEALPRRAPRALDDALAPEDVWASIWFASAQARPAQDVVDTATNPAVAAVAAAASGLPAAAALVTGSGSGAGLASAPRAVLVRDFAKLPAGQGMAQSESIPPQPVLAQTPAPLHADPAAANPLAALLVQMPDAHAAEVTPAEILAMLEQARGGSAAEASWPSQDAASAGVEFTQGLSALGAAASMPARDAAAAAPPTALDLRLPQAPAQLAESIVWHLDQGLQEVSIDLHPAELGRMEIRLKLEGDRVDLRFDMADSQVQDMVKTSLPQLATMLSARGLMLDQAQVFSQSRQGGGNAKGQQSDQSEGSESVTATVTGVRTIRRGLVDDYV